MNIKEFTFRLTTLKAIKQTDEKGASEPYLWVTFFKIDKSIDELKNIEKPVDTFTPFTYEFRELIPDNISDNVTVTIPPQVGLWRGEIDMDAIVKMLGCIVLLMEEDSTPKNAIQAGKQAFASAIDIALNDLVKKRAALDKLLQDLTEKEQEEEQEKVITFVSKKVKNAILSKLKAWDFLKNQDDQIGVSIYTLQDIRTITSFELPIIQYKLNNPPNTPPPWEVIVVNQYAINGDLVIRDKIPPKPDPCKTQRKAVEEKRKQIDGTRGGIINLQTSLQTASPSAKPGIIKFIRTLNEELEKAEAELLPLEEALKNCLNLVILTPNLPNQTNTKNS